jgi:hypothetical protein
MKVWETSGSYLFEEKQSFPRWLLYMIWVTTFFSVGLILAVSLQEGGIKSVLFGLTVVIVIQGLNIYFLTYTRLHKIITSNGVYYRWTPFHKKFRYLAVEEIASVEIRKGPSLNYGYSVVRGYGRVHNLSDGKGLQLFLRNGKKVYFSTANLPGLEKAIASMLPETLKMKPLEF